MANYGFSCLKCGHNEVSDTTCNGWDCPKCGQSKTMWHDLNVKGGALDAYAWPGGYPIIYVIGGEVFCNKCAAELRDSEDGCTNITHDTYMEGPPEDCAECGAVIESAYGDPEEA